MAWRLGVAGVVDGERAGRRRLHARTSRRWIRITAVTGRRYDERDYARFHQAIDFSTQGASGANVLNQPGMKG